MAGGCAGCGNTYCLEDGEYTDVVGSGQPGSCWGTNVRVSADPTQVLGPGADGGLFVPSACAQISAYPAAGQLMTGDAIVTSSGALCSTKTYQAPDSACAQLQALPPGGVLNPTVLVPGIAGGACSLYQAPAAVTQEQVQDWAAPLLANASNPFFAYNDAGNRLQLQGVSQQFNVYRAVDPMGPITGTTTFYQPYSTVTIPAIAAGSDRIAIAMFMSSVSIIAPAGANWSVIGELTGQFSGTAVVRDANTGAASVLVANQITDVNSYLIPGGSALTIQARTGMRRNSGPASLGTVYATSWLSVAVIARKTA